MLIIAGSYSGVYTVYIHVNKQCTLHLLGITSQGMRQRSFICSFVFKPFPFHRPVFDRLLEYIYMSEVHASFIPRLLVG